MTLGFNRASIAKFLQVSTRTIYYWESGSTPIPFATYKLLRVMARDELPGKWDGWSFSRGVLWSPEGHGFAAKDLSWLSLTVRKAALFTEVYNKWQASQAKLKELSAVMHGSHLSVTSPERGETAAPAHPGPGADRRDGLVTRPVCPKNGNLLVNSAVARQDGSDLVTRPVCLTDEISEAKNRGLRTEANDYVSWGLDRGRFAWTLRPDGSLGGSYAQGDVR
ncbi:MAG: VC1465 family Xer recombination activation factor [Aquabacterium sp.]|jgi:hypothetical protein|uniref:VC1465 family Xer recombination activation factor n=1 Tax=Aquabacterium sp. TaxID=1872578 RepID=UPI002A36931F|nr:VC1465 family Xer recombination activation factor [Aquabacterium sp.]MDX9842185.1 VC1465 family Xer recombination activation factor [Aquabacterium sp.]